jgi:hypothetical protein
LTVELVLLPGRNDRLEEAGEPQHWPAFEAYVAIQAA